MALPPCRVLLPDTSGRFSRVLSPDLPLPTLLSRALPPDPNSVLSQVALEALLPRLLVKRSAMAEWRRVPWSLRLSTLLVPPRAALLLVPQT